MNPMRQTGTKSPRRAATTFLRPALITASVVVNVLFGVRELANFVRKPQSPQSLEGFLKGHGESASLRTPPRAVVAPCDLEFKLNEIEAKLNALDYIDSKLRSLDYIESKINNLDYIESKIDELLIESSR